MDIFHFAITWLWIIYQNQLTGSEVAMCHKTNRTNPIRPVSSTDNISNSRKQIRGDNHGHAKDNKQTTNHI